MRTYKGPCKKEIYVEIRTFATMHRFIVMRQDDIQSLVAAPPPYELYEEIVWQTWTWEI